MEQHNIPVVLVVAGIKINYISAVVLNLSKNCNFRMFYVICPEKDIDRARSNTVGLRQSVTIVNEELIIPGLTLRQVGKMLKLSLPGWPVHHLPGWYFQQFLKMGFSQYSPNHKYYLIWDVDTLVTRPISFFDDNVILLTEGNEFHKDYFDTINTLFEDIRLQPVSHISQHLMVKTEDMSNLIQHLEKPESKWWITILSSLNGKSSFQFSEYETYANFCLFKKPESYRSVKRMWLRYGKSYLGCDLPQADISSLTKLYDFVAFEGWDSGFTRRIRSYLSVGLHRVQLGIKRFMEKS
jgi:hypothetical protein